MVMLKKALHSMLRTAGRFVDPPEDTVSARAEVIRARDEAIKARDEALKERDYYKALIGNSAWWTHHRYHNLNATPMVSEGSVSYSRSAIDRLLRAYRSSDSGQYGEDSVWKVFFNTHHTEIHDVFMGDDTEKAFSILSNPQNSDLFYGFDGLCRSLEQQRLETLGAIAQREQDNLIRLAEALGAIDLENPENVDNWGKYKDISTDQVMDLIETTLNREISFPTIYSGAVGIESSRGLICYRSLQALYLAIRLRQLAGDYLQDRPSVSICEIGAGLGRSAYFAHQLGLADYTLVDIPMTAISQGFYLIQLLGEEAVVLPGEKRSVNSQVQILHPDEYFNADGRYDIVVNMDSLTELGRDVAMQYIKKISHSARLFMSINHETNSIRVFDLIEESGCPYRIQRFPCWMRRGYVEELIGFD